MILANYTPAGWLALKRMVRAQHRQAGFGLVVEKDLSLTLASRYIASSECIGC
jgi:hypothetical protein